MNVSLYQAAAALNANSRWQEIISQNLGASTIPGFKKKEISLAAVKAGLVPPGSLDSLSAPQYFTIPKVTASTNFSPGEMKYSGSKTDLAIEGKGFFEVRLPNGSIAHTRDGEFHFTAQGQLVTKQGYSVMGESGPIQIDTNNPAQVSISPTGEVSQGPDIKGKVKVTDFDRPELLTQISGGYFMAGNDPNLHPMPSTATVRQGFVEMSNTSTVAEMANLMTAMRTFESNQRIIQMQDERMGRVISDLGNPTS